MLDKYVCFSIFFGLITVAIGGTTEPAEDNVNQLVLMTGRWLTEG